MIANLQVIDSGAVSVLKNLVERNSLRRTDVVNRQCCSVAGDQIIAVIFHFLTGSAGGGRDESEGVLCRTGECLQQKRNDKKKKSHDNPLFL